ncbi:ABC transporter permease [Reichenbachiella sp.]|uniref:ABC transporter permease n=1 Tax=Reichenbachiella sp. TaxID=2184521 RepID=UPI00329A6BE9
MFTNHLKVAGRNLMKRKEFSMLNLLGLSIGMAACLLILQYVKYEMNYDKFYKDASRMYRLNLGMSDPDKVGVGMMSTNHPAAGPALKADFPQIEEVTRVVDVKIFAGSSVLSYKGKNGEISTFYESNIYIADSTFFDVFSLPLISGDPSSALSGPRNFVISEHTARRYFGEQDPMGETVALQGDFEVTITGVMKDIPENSHLNIDGLLSLSVFEGNIDNTWIWPEFHTYVKLKPNTEVQGLESQLDVFVLKYLGDVMEEFGIKEKMELQQITDIHLYSEFDSRSEDKGSAQMVSFLVIIAAIILLIAWINYVNLSTARSLERAPEVGIRKVIGARKQDLFQQFLVESALINILAILVSIVLVYLFASPFNTLVGKTIFQDVWLSGLWSQSTTWIILLMFLFGGTILAGSYPALVLSSFKPIKTIKSKFYSGGQKLSFRQVMVVFQFTVSILMIAGTLIVFDQLSFMQKKQLGFNMDQVLVVKAPSMTDSTYNIKEAYFKNEILKYAGIQQFTASSSIPGGATNGMINSIKKKGQSTEEATFALYIFTDEGFLQTYEIDVIAGRNFSENIASDRDAVMLNRKAVKQMGFSTPEEVLGQVISIKQNRWSEVTVIGVVENINYRSLVFEQSPMAFFNFENAPIDYYSFKVSAQDMSNSIAQIEEVYARIFPGNPIEYFFLDNHFAEQYKADEQFSHVFSVFSGLSIIVTCLGLLGLASYMAARRTKEVGIRKVLGASPELIFVLLGKQFFWLVLIGAAIAIPLSWWGGNLWLDNYAYRTPLSAWLFIASLLAVMLVAAVTVVWQTSRSAFINPVDAIRYE